MSSFKKISQVRHQEPWGDRDFLGTQFPNHFISTASHVFSTSSVLSLLNYSSHSMQTFPSANANLPTCLLCLQCSDPFPQSQSSCMAWVHAEGWPYLCSKSHIFPRQTSQFPLFDLHSSSYHCVASVFLFSALWASLSRIMLSIGIFLSASSLIWYWGALPSIAVWSQDLLIRSHYKFLWCGPRSSYFLPPLWALEPISHTSSLGKRDTSSTFVLPRPILLFNWWLINPHGGNIWMVKRPRV